VFCPYDLPSPPYSHQLPPAPPAAAAGMDNFIKVWCLDQHRHTLDASDEWKPGARRAFRAGHVTTPAFSTEVGRGRGA
jgi:hypothetical protein